jgi:hypothetical protein
MMEQGKSKLKLSFRLLLQKAISGEARRATGLGLRLDLRLKMVFKKRKPKKEKENTDLAPSSFKGRHTPKLRKGLTQQIFVMKNPAVQRCMRLYRRTSYQESLGSSLQAFQPTRNTAWKECSLGLRSEAIYVSGCEAHDRAV